MGTHAKPRTTGRKAALGALAFGASLTGVGLIAAALDPSTAVLTATGEGDGGTTQLSGLSSPVSMDLTPAADTVTDLTSAPLPSTAAPAVGSAATAAGYPARHGGPDVVDWFTKPAKSSTGTRTATKPSGSSSGGESAVKPIVYSNPAKNSSSSGSGGGTTTVASSGAPPTETSGISTAVQDAVAPVASTTSAVLPAVQSLVGQVPIVSTVVPGTGAAGTVSSLPVVGTLLGGGGAGQSTVNVPGLSAVAGLL